MLCDRSLSFFHSFCHNWRTRKRTSTKLGRHGKRWPSRSGWLLVVIRMCAWIPVFHFLRHWGIGDFPTFVSIYLFSSVLIQSTADFNLTWRNEWRRRMYPQFWNGYSTEIRIEINPKIWIRIRITFVSNLPSTVNMAISCIVCELLVENREFFYTPPVLSAPAGEFCEGVWYL